MRAGRRRRRSTAGSGGRPAGRPPSARRERRIRGPGGRGRGHRPASATSWPAPARMRLHGGENGPTRMESRNGRETPQDTDRLRSLPPLDPHRNVIGKTRNGHWRAHCGETRTVSSEGGRAERTSPAGTSPRGPPYITQVRPLLDPVGLTGVVVTLDALHCQRETARYLVEDKHTYGEDGSPVRTR